MIPREILKKIRQSEIRTNRIVTGFAAGARLCEPRNSRIAQSRRSSQHVLPGEVAAGRRPALRSFQPPAQFCRIPCAVKDGNYNHHGRIIEQCEVDGIRPVQHFYLLGSRPGKRKSFAVFGGFGKCGVDFTRKSLTHPVGLRIIPSNRLVEFRLGLGFEGDLKTHFLARYRFSISAMTSSSGRQRSGCARASAARRSSSAICSGVSLGSNSSRRRAKTWYCSSNDSLWICSKTWVALMASKLNAVKHFASA